FARHRRRRRELCARSAAMTPLAPHMEAFFREHLVRHRGLSPHTCDSYAYSFQSLFEFASQKLRVAPSALMLEQLDASLISSFLEHLETARGNSAETRNIRLAAIRSFFRFLQHHEPAPETMSIHPMDDANMFPPMNTLVVCRAGTMNRIVKSTDDRKIRKRCSLPEPVPGKRCCKSTFGFARGSGHSSFQR